ncbi:MAG: hypothetical protein GX803_07735 [Lentisphaerae bacterium]|nr:hypothetical protein [Lentisphaerota bacterium]
MACLMLTPPVIVTLLLEQHTPVTFRASGPSMNPTLRDGDVVQVVPPPSGPLKLGSLVLYRLYGRLALHRVVRRDCRSQRWFIVGDAAVAGGDWIATADILGLATRAHRQDRVILLATRRVRYAGRLRFALRPLRRALNLVRQALHASTSSRKKG